MGHQNVDEVPTLGRTDSGTHAHDNPWTDEKEPSSTGNEKEYGKAERLGADPEALTTDRNGVLAGNLEEVAAMADKLDIDEARKIISETVQQHKLDPNFPSALLEKAVTALAEEDLNEHTARSLIDEIKVQAALLDDSPYVEVRAVVPNTDDSTMPVGTIRAWVIGMIFTLIGTGVNQFFNARQPPLVLSTFVAQLLAYPLGKAWEKAVPNWRIFGADLNPGPFNMKEHMLITIMANVTFGGNVGVYSTDIIFVQRIPQFFNQNALGSKAGYQILLTMSTQLIGFSLAGLSRRFLVYPPAMIWPTNLATIAMNRSFHAPGNPVANGWRISRMKFFLIVFTVYGLLWVLPDAIWQSLSIFNWITWIAPNNVDLAIVAGQIGGLGLINPLPTFDWAYLNYLNPPLITPYFATLNMTIGALLTGVAFIIPIFYTNTWNSGYLPINDNGVYDRMGQPYNVTAVLGPDGHLNTEAYEAYSPVYLTAGNAMVYAWFFAIYTATIVYVGLHNRREVFNGFKAAINFSPARQEYSDVHNRLMLSYNEVPEWWFLSVLAVSFAFGVAAIEHYHTNVPVWALVFAVCLALVFIVPVGIIQAVANIPVTMNVFAELVGGYALPGQPLANMIFKAYGYITTAQAISYAQDLKLAHYTKLPPRTVFSAQLVASVVAVFVALGVTDWEITNISDICDRNQKDHFNCAGYRTFYTAAVVWGTIGPARLWSHGGLYYATIYGFLIGAIVPIPFWFLANRYPSAKWKLFHMPAFIYGGINWSPYNFSYVGGALPYAWFFMSYVRRRWLPWWSKYNYILATALSSSVAVWGVIWYFAILYKDKAPEWWGNEIYLKGFDANGGGRLTIPDSGFGPGPGEFHA